MISNATTWDIFLAEVVFEDIPGSKKRPVLYLEEQDSFFICLKMTGTAPRFGEYALQDWQGAGLHKPTTVRIGKRLRLSQNDIICKIGHLSAIDIYSLSSMI